MIMVVDQHDNRPAAGEGDDRGNRGNNPTRNNKTTGIAGGGGTTTTLGRGASSILCLAFLAPFLMLAQVWNVMLPQSDLRVRFRPITTVYNETPINNYSDGSNEEENTTSQNRFGVASLPILAQTTSVSSSASPPAMPRICSILGAGNQQHGNRGTSAADDESRSPRLPLTNLTVDSLCHCIPHWTQGKSQSTATSLWSDENTIKKAVLHAAYMSFKDCWSMVPNALTTANEMAFQNLTEHMFRSLNSHRLKKSIKTKASPFVMERLLQVILRRLEDPENNPPLKIAVFGGSVTEGSQSRTNTLNIIKTTTQQQVCAWAYKLETLLNQIAATLFYKNHDDPDGQQYQQNHQQDKTNKTKIVEVHNFAVSATDSSIGKTLLEYRLFGADMSTMDLIISAFGANDMQSPVGLDRDQIYLDMQGFMRLAKLQRPCNDLPLVLQIDDVFADALRPTVRQGFRYFNEMVETNNWAGFMSLSYADAVRDVLYANPNDEMLHEFGHVHPGVTFHTGMSWIIAYNLLEGLLDACDASSLPEHKNKEPRNGFPLPLLHDELVAQEVSQLWTEHSDKMTQFCAQTNVTRISQCEYKYIAHRLGANTSEMVQQVISSVATNIDGWEGSGFPIRPPKRTWKATRENATFTIQLDHISMPINRMLVLYVKSYGKAWEGTRLSVVVEGKTMSGDGQDDDNDNISKDISSSASGWTELKTLELTGMHDARTSINYSEHIDLGAFLKVGSSVRATFTLVSGGTFQINALALGYFPQPT